MENAHEALGRLKAGGRKIIGCFPLYPPLPVFHALDLVPVVLWGLSDLGKGTPQADRHVQSYACSVARRLAQFVLSESAGMLDGIFFYNACDTLRNLPEVLRAGIEDAGAAAPPMFRMHVPMAPLSQTDASAYLRKEAENLIESLEKTYGEKFSEEKFRQSVALYSRIRSHYLSLEKAVAQGVLGFADFCGTMAGAGFLPPEEQEKALQAAVSLLPPSPLRKDSAGKIFISGILPPPPPVCRLIDQAGLVVAGNDIASMRRFWCAWPESFKDAADFCVRFYLDHFPCSTLLNLSGKRVDAVAEAALESGADGFVFAGEKFCEYEYFDIPDIEKATREKGLSVLQLEFAMDGGENVEAFKTRIEAFAEVLSQKSGRAAQD